MNSSRIVTPIISEIKGEINVKLFARTWEVDLRSQTNTGYPITEPTRII